jgi:hypothetical protein
VPSAVLSFILASCLRLSRALMTGLLNTPYSPGQMTYDLRRLRLAGLIRRIEHTNRYVLTPDGIVMAVFYTKLHNRLLRPSWQPASPRHPRPSVTPCTSSTSTSTTTSLAHGPGKPRENLTQTSKLATKDRYSPSGTPPGRSGPFGAVRLMS